MSCSRWQSHSQCQGRSSNLTRSQGGQLISLTPVLPGCQMKGMRWQQHTEMRTCQRGVSPGRFARQDGTTFCRTELGHGDPSQGLDGAKLGLQQSVFPALTLRKRSGVFGAHWPSLLQTSTTGSLEASTTLPSKRSGCFHAVNLYNETR